VAARVNPGRKRFQFATVVDGRDTAQVEPGVASELLDAGWKISGQSRWLVVSQPSAGRRSAKTTSSPKGYHFTADRFQLPTGLWLLNTGM
jgi:hypothetical protein